MLGLQVSENCNTWYHNFFSIRVFSPSFFANDSCTDTKGLLANCPFASNCIETNECIRHYIIQQKLSIFLHFFILFRATVDPIAQISVALLFWDMLIRTVFHSSQMTKGWLVVRLLIAISNLAYTALDLNWWLMENSFHNSDRFAYKFFNNINNDFFL